MDNKGTGYYVHAGSAPVQSVRHPQKWFYLWPDYLVDKNTDPFELRLSKFKNDKFRDLPDADLEQYYKPTTGDFALAYFEHGRKPDAAACIYSMLIKTTPGEMAKFAGEMRKPGAGLDVPGARKGKSPPYVILQKDAKAHILWDSRHRHHRIRDLLQWMAGQPRVPTCRLRPRQNRTSEP